MGEILGCRDSVVGIATRYGLDGPEIESPNGARLPVPSRPAPMPTQPPVVGTGSFPWVMRPERGAEHPPPSSARLRMGSGYTSAAPLCLPRHVMG